MSRLTLEAQPHAAGIDGRFWRIGMAIHMTLPGPCYAAPFISLILASIIFFAQASISALGFVNARAEAQR